MGLNLLNNQAKLKITNKHIQLRITKRLALCVVFLLIYGAIFMCFYTFMEPPAYAGKAESILLYAIVTMAFLLVAVVFGVIICVGIFKGIKWLFEDSVRVWKDKRY